MTSNQRYGVAHLSGDQLPEGAEAGWYWGVVNEDGALIGNLTGPFKSKEEADVDLCDKHYPEWEKIPPSDWLPQ